MYSLNLTKKSTEYIFLAIKKYYKNYNGTKRTIKKHFGIEPEQFQNIYQQMDVGGPYNSFDEMYKNFNKEVGTHKNVKISKIKYKKAILLLLSYHKNIIIF
jgi:hypothetical protein